jgi:radical SAM protein with 4Fe4S-binding SPASM domain
LAFQRHTGDLIELDEQAFEVLATLSHATDLREMTALMRYKVDHPPRLPELAHFLQELDGREFLECASVSKNSDPPSTVCSRLLDRYSRRLATATSRKRDVSAPVVAHWAVTYRCNLACSFCYSESGPHREYEPPPITRNRIVQRLADWGIFEVALGGGEPTVLPDFPELLAAIRHCGMVPNVTTNGTLNSARVTDAIAEHVGTVHLSADRFDLLDAARGTGVSTRVRETAQRLSARNVLWGVNLLLNPHNARSLSRSLSELQDLGATAITLLRPKGKWAAQNWPGFPTRAALSAITSAVNRFIKRRPTLRLYVDTALRGEWFDAGLLDDLEPDVLGCGGGERHVAITPNGDVFPCSHAHWRNLHMGNLLRDDADQIWLDGPGLSARRRYRKMCCGTTCPCIGHYRTRPREQESN